MVEEIDRAGNAPPLVGIWTGDRVDAFDDVPHSAATDLCRTVGKV